MLLNKKNLLYGLFRLKQSISKTNAPPHPTTSLFAFLISILFYLLGNQLLIAQTYNNHFGTGNNIGISISSSPTQGVDSAALTLNGTGFFTDLAGASRFLAQAGFGGTYEEIEYVSQVGIDAWLEEQFDKSSGSFLSTYQANYDEITAMIQPIHPDEPIIINRTYTDFVFWSKVFQEEDILRNKAAFALHQIFVLSTLSNTLRGLPAGGADYYDILYEGAFGNFRDLLSKVTLHPVMGFYLSHFRNRKGDPSKGTLPDENYAREIMQLFTIGLYELNNDGSYKFDDNGARIPTYDITDIQELAKVFTGLSGGAYNLEAFPELANQPLSFFKGIARYDLTVPMIMWEQYHEQGEKTLVDGTTLPAGQSGMKDIQDALDVLFNHPNVGPFIAIRLIQQLVKSNPTPAYINRVASVFNNNGQGIRGDMKAVFRAILTDTEARNCTTIETATTGKLRQPLERLISLCRAFHINSPSGKLWISEANILADEVEQTFMGAPSVFNFFTPFYAEDTYVAPNEMVSPEFQILHSVTAIHYLNLMENTISTTPFRNYTAPNPNKPRLKNNKEDKLFLDLSDEIAILENDGLDALLDRLDLVLCQKQLSTESRKIIRNALTQLDDPSMNYTSEDKVRAALYFIVTTADFAILK